MNREKDRMYCDSPPHLEKEITSADKMLYHITDLSSYRIDLLVLSLERLSHVFMKKPPHLMSFFSVTVLSVGPLHACECGQQESAHSDHEAQRKPRVGRKTRDRRPRRRQTRHTEGKDRGLHNTST